MGQDKKDKITNNQLQEMFQDGNLIARGLYVNLTKQEGRLQLNFSEVENEMKHLRSQKIDGEHNNVERNGQRNRSATMLVPDIEMDLFADVGVIYDGDKSTIRAYMFKDSVTRSPFDHKGFYNVNVDKQKFQPIISKKDFLEKYRNFRNKTDNTPESEKPYNEILGNFYPDSMVSLIGKNDLPITKIKLLGMRNYFREKHNKDLPMTIMEDGKVQVWNPNTKEIASLLEHSKKKIEELSKKFPDISKTEKLQEFAEDLGYNLEIKNYSDKIAPENISSINKQEIKLEELEKYMSAITGIPKGGSLTYGIEGRLKEVVNRRLLDEGLEKIDNFKNYIVQKEDVENLISLLDKEIALKTPNHKPLDGKEVKNLAESIINNIADKRGAKGNEIEELRSNLSLYTNPRQNKVREFGIKTKALISNNVITRKVKPVQSKQNNSHTR